MRSPHSNEEQGLLRRSVKRSQRAKIARPAGRPRRPSGRPRSQLPNGNGAPTIVGYRNGAQTIVGMTKNIKGELPGMEASCQLTLAKLPPAGGSSANRPTSAHHPQGDTMQKDLCKYAKSTCARKNASDAAAASHEQVAKSIDRHLLGNIQRCPSVKDGSKKGATPENATCGHCSSSR